MIVPQFVKLYDATPMFVQLEEMLTAVCPDTQYNVPQASCGQVEVVGTTHATTGVRRLVKSVVRGLKACQVRLCFCRRFMIRLELCHFAIITLAQFPFSLVISRPC